MTRARAIELLKRFQLCCDFDDCTNAWDCNECAEALNLAIETLEQEPCDDCIWFQQEVQRTQRKSDDK